MSKRYKNFVRSHKGASRSLRSRPISIGIQKAITNGINFLAKEQEKDGSFFSLVSAGSLNFKKARKQQIVFLNILILSCLNSLEATPGIKSIKDKLVKFLLSQKSVYWSFNYLARNSKEAKAMLYPDDLDDTFCALSAIYEHDPSLIDGKVLAKAVTVLTALEEKEGGPYRTWLVPTTASAVWQDVDLAVNANIGYFLSLQEIDLPNIIGLIESAVYKTKYVSPYYPNEYAIIYFISRFYRGNRSQKIINFLLKKKGKNYWGNSMNAALAISSLVNLGFSAEKLEKAVNSLLNKRKNGAWQPFGFCIDHIVNPVRNSHGALNPAFAKEGEHLSPRQAAERFASNGVKSEKHYAGSSALTAAFCLEAINKYEKISNYSNYSKKILNPKLLKKEKEIYGRVLQKYKQRFSGFSKNFQEKAVAAADKILKKNKDIVLLPYYFRNALWASGRKVSDDFIVQLGVANLFGWIAYTIYDDFLDEEGEPAELSLANVCLRESAEIFGTVLPYATGFPTFSKKIFDIIDDANMWEVTHCRFDVSKGDYLSRMKQAAERGRGFVRDEQLANKSLGHALGPIAILFALGHKAHSAEVRNTMRFFRNYIIARQLNDDAHDWEDDLKRGQVNTVGARLLSARGGSASGGKDAGHEKANFEKLREIFWHKTIVGACKDILRHVEFAKKDLKKLSFIKEPDPSSSPSTGSTGSQQAISGHYGAGIFMGMLAAIERSAEEALKEREETMKFLKTYR